VRVLALRALGLGDLLTAVPALRALQDLAQERALRNPTPRKGSDPLTASSPARGPGAADGFVAVATPRGLAPLVELAGCRHVDAAPLGRLGAEAHGVDLLVNLHGRGPQSHRVALAARPARLVAFAHPEVPESAGMPAWDPGEHEVRRWCRLLTESGIPADPARLGLPDPGVPPPGPDRTGATVVHPGAASGARRWPAARFARVAAEEARAGRRVVVTGSAEERPLALGIARGAGLPDEAVLAGRTDVAQLATLVARAARVVCGDTGVAHLATAFGTPSVLLFGPTSPRTWGPPSGPGHRVLWAGRTGDPHAPEPDPGLLSIAPADVLGELALLP
jgi:ADP-heptose:LPS heptosyltransferase